MQTPRFIAILSALFCTALLLTGCGAYDAISSIGKQPTGALAVAPRLGDQQVVEAGFDNALYTYDDKDTVTAVLFDGDLESPTRAAVVRMFWRPKAGATPIDSNATNATLHFVDFTNQQVAVYSGAGFVFPSQSPGADKLTLGVWDADLRLMDATKGYTDTISPAVMRGKLTARLDQAAADAALRQINQQIRAQLGYSRIVEAVADDALQMAGL